jgi:hypothetical protein
MPMRLGPDLEPAMERLLARLVPDFTSQVEGATPDEIATLEGLAGRPLPQFYQWFLWRMGRNMGPLAYRSLDFSARRILASYEDGTFKSDPRLLMIGYETDELYPVHIAYDFDHTARDDARVTRATDEPLLEDQSFETFREMLAYGVLSRTKLSVQGQRLEAVLSDKAGGGVAAQLAPVMANLGFTSPIETGEYCSLFEREDAVLIGFMYLGRDPAMQATSLGARGQAEIRSLLGTITTETGLEVSIDEWDPPLP